MSRHLHPTVEHYCRNRRLAVEYDAAFADNALFDYDCRFLDQHLRNLPDKQRPRALDLGCGTGRHLLHLARRGWDTVGVDLNPHILAVARDKLLHAGVRVFGPDPGTVPPPASEPDPWDGHDPGDPAPRARLAQADFHHLPWPDAWTFDAILIMFSTIGLVRPAARREALLSALRKRLRPGGRLFLHTHNANFRRQRRREPGALARWIKAAGKAAARLASSPPDADPVLDGPDAAGPYEPGDQIMRGYRGELDLFLHLFTMRELENLLADAGYRITELRPLAATRDGPCLDDDPNVQASGFLVCAVSD